MPYERDWSIAASGGPLQDAPTAGDQAYTDVLDCLSKSTGSFDAYDKIIAAIIKNKRSESYLILQNTNIKWLNLNSTTKDKNGFTTEYYFTLDEVGVLELKQRVATQKLNELEDYVLYAASDGKSKITTLYEQSERTVILSNDLVDYRQKLLLYFSDASMSADQDNFIIEIDQIIKKLINEFNATRIIKELNDTKTLNLEQALLKLRALFRDTIDVSYKRSLATSLIEEAGSRILRYIANNPTRISNIYGELELNYSGSISSTDPVESANALSALQTIILSSDDNLIKAVSKYAIYHVDIVNSAMDDLIRKMEIDCGIDILQRAQKLAFNQDQVTVSVAKELLNVIDDILRYMRLKLYWHTLFGNRVEIPGIFRPYIFYRNADYREMLNLEVFNLNHTSDTPNNTIDIPLNMAFVASNPQRPAIFFYNPRPGFLLLDFPDIDRPRHLDLIANGTRIVWWKAGQAGPKKTNFLSYGWRLGYGFATKAKSSLPLYCLTDADDTHPATVQPHLFQPLTSGYASGIGRADPVSPEDYRWAFGGDLAAIQQELRDHLGRDAGFEQLTVPLLGAFFGLEEENALFKAQAKFGGSYLWSETALDDGNIQYEANYGIRYFSKNGLNYLVIPSNYKNSSSYTYFVMCNTPYIYTPKPSPSTTANNPVQINIDKKAPKKPFETVASLQNILFYYFRRVEGGFPDVKVFKRVGQDNNRPWAQDVEKYYTDKAKVTVAFGLNLPISMHLNYQWLDEKKKQLAAIKNKGTALRASRAKREPAGTIMAEIIPYAKPRLNLKGKSLSANDLVAALAASRANPTPNDGEQKPLTNQPADDPGLFQRSWQGLKQTQLESLPTDQEWCHLKGHGDDGGERIGNFVSGSYHCNTEQLAIELAQRPTTQAVGNATYSLNSTAYLIPDDSMQIFYKKSYLQTDPDYLRNGYETNLLSKAAADTSMADTESKSGSTQADAKIDTAHQAEIDRSGLNAPVAAFIRYKINKSTGSGSLTAPKTVTKVLDYTFEGQSEFIDRNQFQILRRTVQYMLDPASFRSDLIAFYNTRHPPRDTDMKPATPDGTT